MQDSEINPRKKLVVGVLTCIDEELKLAQLNLHILHAVLCWMTLCGKFCVPRRTTCHIFNDANIRSPNRFAIVAKGLVQVHQERNSGLNKPVEVLTIGIDRAKLTRDANERRNKGHH
jgi:hypothetical protein